MTYNDDDWKREQLLRGEPLHFPEGEPEEHRVVQAEWLEEAARAGKVVDVNRAIVRGVVDLKYASMAEELTVTRSELTDHVDFLYATARRPIRQNLWSSTKAMIVRRSRTKVSRRI